MQHLDGPARAEMTGAILGETIGPLRAQIEGDHVVIPFHARIARAERCDVLA